jgi:hypothetical protein
MEVRNKKENNGGKGVLKEGVESSWNVMAHSAAWEGKWRGNWRMVWVACTLHTISEHGLSSITNADGHTSAASSRLNWRPPADLNGLVRFSERRNLVSAHVPSHFKRSLPNSYVSKQGGNKMKYKRRHESKEERNKRTQHKRTNK